MTSPLARPFKIFGSLGLSTSLLLLLALLTWLGTLEQVHMGLFDVQKKYFESLFLVHWAGALPIPLPGAYLVMILLGANLVVGGIIRLRRKKANAGVLITHAGILFLLFAGLIKLSYSQEGSVRLYEGQGSDTFQSYYRDELVLQQQLETGGVREFIVPQERFAGTTGATTLRSAALSFDVVISDTMRNCWAQPKGPMFEVDVPVIDGAFLKRLPAEKQAEENSAGLYATVVDKADGSSQQGILWDRDRAPWVIDVAGERWALELRKERYTMPFTVQLDDFTKQDHPRMGMAKEFSSDVTVTEGNSARQVKISMNEPLRDQGLVLYQASWGPPNARPGERLFSVLAVVRNPADQYPLYACIIIAIGLVLHFTNRLLRYVRAEGKVAR